VQFKRTKCKIIFYNFETISFQRLLNLSQTPLIHKLTFVLALKLVYVVGKSSRVMFSHFYLPVNKF